MASVGAGIEEAAEQLREKGFEVEIHSDSDIPMLLLRSFLLPEGWSQEQTELLLRLPPAFPDAKPDMFWTESELRLADGSVPKQADVIQKYLGRDWRRFSWHLSKWSPASDDILTFIEFIERRLRHRV